MHRLGDTVFTIPAVREIIKYYDKKITIICYSSYESIYKLEFRNVDFICVEKEEFYWGRRIASSRIRKIVKKLSPEIIFDITGTPASASMIFGCSAGSIVGMNVKYFRKIYSDFTTIRKTPHFMDIYTDVIKLKIPVADDKSNYAFQTAIHKEAKILIHPFAIRQAKQWNLKKFLELAEIFNEEYKVEIVSPPGFIEEDILDDLASEGIDNFITKNIDELITKTRDCSLFVANDSGPTYIANLIGKPTYAIYGPTNPAYSLPFGGEHRFIQKKLECSAKNQKFCFTMGGIHCPSNECMQIISVEEVSKDIKKFLKELHITERKINN